MKIIILIFLTLCLCSCKTYKHSKVINEWRNKWGDKILIVETKQYNRKDKSIINSSIDTFLIENKPLDGSFIYNN